MWRWAVWSCRAAGEGVSHYHPPTPLPLCLCGAVVRGPPPAFCPPLKRYVSPRPAPSRCSAPTFGLTEGMGGGDC